MKPSSNSPGSSVRTGKLTGYSAGDSVQKDSVTCRDHVDYQQY
jgi:hypothetical protein